MANKKSRIRRAICIFDLHYPLSHKPTVRAIFDYVKKNPPDVLLFGGDQLDLACISHHTKNQPLYRARRSFLHDIEGFEKDILTPLEKLLPRDCKRVWLTGNHERFAWDFVEANPELEDTIDPVRLLKLAQRRWEVVPLGHSYKLGKLKVTHGEILSGYGNQGPLMTARKAMELFAGNVLCGHTHSPQMFTKVSPVEENNKWQAYVSPIAGATNPAYMRNRPSSWVNGFTIVEFDETQFNVYLINVLNGQFAYGGKVYGRK